MNIKKLSLSNILSHTSSSYGFEKLTVFRGHNGSGKTTIINAIRIALAGFGERDMQQWLRNDEAEGAIDVVAEDSNEVREIACAITRKSGRSAQCSKPNDKGYVGSDYLAYLQQQQPVLSALIDPRTFFAQSDAEQKEVLASIILPKSIEFDAELFAALQRLKLNIRYDLKPADFIDEAYKAAYDERTIVNRKLKEWRQPEELQGNVPTVAEVTTRLAERQASLVKATTERASLLASYETTLKAERDYAERSQTLDARLSTERQSLEGAEKNLLTPAQLREHRSLITKAANGDKINSELTSTQHQIAAARKANMAFVDMCNKGGDFPKCPTCHRELSDESIAAVDSEFGKQIVALQLIEEDFIRQRKELGDYEAAKHNVAAHEQAVKDTAMIKQHIAEIEKDIKSLGKVADVSKPPTDKLDAEIADLTARIKKGQETLAIATNAENSKRQYAEALAAKKVLDETSAILERLCDYFGPKGVKTRLLDENIADFQKSMNAVLDSWGFECRLSFEPYSFSMRVKDHSWHTLRTISASQKQMFIAAFQVALAVATRIKLVCIDAADIFLTYNRNMLYRNLIAALKENILEQAIVMQSDERKDVPTNNGKPVDGMAFYMLTLNANGETVSERL